MNQYVKSILLWILAFVLTVGAAIYQKKTGPTYPISGEIQFENETVKYKLLRSEEISENQKFTTIKIISSENISGKYKYRRVSSNDDWTFQNMERVKDTLYLKLPQLKELAGKYEYQVSLSDGKHSIDLTEEPIRIRYKGAVPNWILLPHIIFMFFGMWFSSRTAIASVAKERKSIFTYATLTVISLLVGGLILGPIVQKYAFDAYWTGWPFGGDLTDNKTIIMFLVWLVAWLKLRKNKNNIFYPVMASLVLLAVYLIPHSAMGSEYNYKEDSEKKSVIIIKNLKQSIDHQKNHFTKNS